MRLIAMLIKPGSDLAALGAQQGGALMPALVDLLLHAPPHDGAWLPAALQAAELMQVHINIC